MFRRLAIVGLALVPVLAGCGQQPLLSVGVRQVTVSPNADNTANDEISIPYSLGVPAHVTITLLQPDGKTIPLRDNDRAAESYALPFTGVIDVPNSTDEKVLADGTYKVVFDARTSTGQTAQQTVQATVKDADPVPLDITNIALSNPTFSPNGQGVRTDANGQQVDLDQTTINYALSKDATVDITVLDKDGSTTPIQAPAQEKAGLQSVTWDGKGPSGIAVANGVYTLHISASDTSGNVTDRTTTVTITDSGTPEVQITSARFFPTALGIGQTLNVEITVKNSGDVPIKTEGPPPGTVYKTTDTYLGFALPGSQQPQYVDTAGRWRVGVRWTSSAGQYPVRWGFFADDNQELQPGQQVTIRGGIIPELPLPRAVDFYVAIEMGGIGFSSEFGQTRVNVAY
ncbi:MAG: hypothetical protein JO247_11885 [Chloroflexi bacterium]|nr:hypothetical protein [Chloroflexota bacterium]